LEIVCKCKSYISFTYSHLNLYTNSHSDYLLSAAISTCYSGHKNMEICPIKYLKKANVDCPQRCMSPRTITFCPGFLLDCLRCGLNIQMAIAQNCNDNMQLA